MFFRRIVSPGLAHFSYCIGSDTEAVVIDPRRDCEVYLDITARRGLNITAILETHRHEDFVVGSLELAKRTRADIWHADAQLEYAYGNPVGADDRFSVGELSLEALHTPGHTPGSMSYLLKDENDNPWMLFCGDLIFAGDLGRVDLFGMDRAPSLAAKMYESLTETVLPLGDHVILCPAHGAGSVCGSMIADREWTTIGLEKRERPHLDLDPHEGSKRAFVERVTQQLERPPYFRTMERLNIRGAPPLASLPASTPLAPDAFVRKSKRGTVLDTRSPYAFCTSHIPNALSIWEDGVPSFAGWFLDEDRPLYLVTEGDDPSVVVDMLRRVGFDRIDAHLAGGMTAWHMAGYAGASIQTAGVEAACTTLDAANGPFLLDVRSSEELNSEGRLHGAKHIHLTQLMERMDEVPDDETIYVFCGSGLRATVAASILRRAGYEQLVVVLGGTKGWSSIRCPIEEK